MGNLEPISTRRTGDDLTGKLVVRGKLLATLAGDWDGHAGLFFLDLVCTPTGASGGRSVWVIDLAARVAITIQQYKFSFDPFGVYAALCNNGEA